MTESIRWVLPGTVLAVAAWIVIGCNGTRLAQHVPQTKVEPAPPTPIAEKKDELGMPSWDPAWDRMIEQSLPPQMLSKNEARAVKPFCPQFQEMSKTDRRVFWAYVFEALASAEAGLKPTTDVQHTEPEVAVKDSVTNRMVRSEGLLQLTYEDSDRYGCAFDWDRDKHLPEKDPQKTILQPENNLKCGIRIMSNQLIDRHEPLATGSSYWSTLRPGTLSYRVFVKQMANVPSACRVPAPVDQAGKPADRSATASSGTSE
jgi:hypothetical protein